MMCSFASRSSWIDWRCPSCIAVRMARLICKLWENMLQTIYNILYHQCLLHFGSLPFHFSWSTLAWTEPYKILYVCLLTWAISRSNRMAINHQHLGQKHHSLAGESTNCRKDISFGVKGNHKSIDLLRLWWSYVFYLHPPVDCHWISRNFE